MIGLVENLIAAVLVLNVYFKIIVIFQKDGFGFSAALLLPIVSAKLRKRYIRRRSYHYFLFDLRAISLIHVRMSHNFAVHGRNISQVILIPDVHRAFEPLRYLLFENPLYLIFVLFVYKLKIIYDVWQLTESAATHNILFYF